MLINLRLGFATNSSSTHSIVFLPKKSLSVDSQVADQEFGWDFWTAASPEAKRAWVGQQLLDLFSDLLPPEACLTVAEKLAQTTLTTKGYVDHQSCLSLPVSEIASKHSKINPEYLADLLAFLSRNDIAILGGNDNNERVHPKAKNTQKINLGLPTDSLALITCRKERDKVWTIFNTDTGTRATFDFNVGALLQDLGKLENPLLADVKITDYCEFNCPYCYQDSTPRGKHASLTNISFALGALHALGVMEVALGGGEPTEHPAFVKILQYCRGQNLVANFTTRSTKWLKDRAQLKEILSYTGGFAFSVDTAAQAKTLLKQYSAACTAAEIPNATRKVSIQCVVGAVPLPEIKKIISVVDQYGDVRLTLLGYKNTGRGTSLVPFPTENLFKMLKKEVTQWCPVGIDTTLAKQFKNEIVQAAIPEILYQTEEGKVSMYWDLVAEYIAPSSYCAKEQQVPFTNLSRWAGFDVETLHKHFATF